MAWLSLLGSGLRRALLNDANPHLINFYGWLKRGLPIDVPIAERRGVYYRHRDRFNALLAAGKADSAEAAALFYYLNRTGYNGLCRFNRRGVFNVPFGRYKTIGYVSGLLRLSRRIRRLDLSPWRRRVRALERGDFVYADPPYDVEFTHYAQGRVLLGRPGADGGMAGQAPWPRRVGESGDRARREVVSQARLLSRALGRAAPDQLHRRPDTRQRSHRDAQPMSPGEHRTGAVLEAMIVPALQHGGYTFMLQQLSDSGVAAASTS